VRPYLALVTIADLLPCKFHILHNAREYSRFARFLMLHGIASCGA